MGDTYTVRLACDNCRHEWTETVQKGVQIKSEAFTPGVWKGSFKNTGVSVLCPNCECDTARKLP